MKKGDLITWLNLHGWKKANDRSGIVYVKNVLIYGKTKVVGSIELWDNFIMYDDPYKVPMNYFYEDLVTIDDDLCVKVSFKCP